MKSHVVWLWPLDSRLWTPPPPATRGQRLGDVEELVGDKGCDGDPRRRARIERGTVPVIPNRKNRTDPRPFEPGPYRERNRVERLFGKAKQFRRFATRYERLKQTLPGMIQLVLGFVRLRRLTNNVNTA